MKEKLEFTQRGEVRQSAGNYRVVLLNDPKLKGAFRLNMLTDKIDITKDLGWYRESDNLTDVDLKFLVLYMEQHYGLSNEKKIDDAIKAVGQEGGYVYIFDLNATQIPFVNETLSTDVTGAVKAKLGI